MNFVVVLPAEIGVNGRASLCGERALHLQETHKLVLNEDYPAVLYGSRRGRVRVVVMERARVELECEWREDPLPRTPVDLIVGISRPQTVKKVVHAAVTCGVRSLHFVRSEQAPKSYMQSHTLREEALDREVLLGLEQCGDAGAPTICVHRTFGWFIEKHLDTIVAPRDTVRLLADPGATPGTENGTVRSVHHTLAIGPEAGWARVERDTFLSHGFIPVGLGERILRTEVALSYLMGVSAVYRGGP